MTNRILVGAVFLVGCAVGGASSQIVVPKANAQQAAQLTKWEHWCGDAGNNASDANIAIHEVGEQGWELAGLSAGSQGSRFAACFKRPKL